MPKWEVRVNCEYVVEVEADTADQALDQALEKDLATWTQAWSPPEAQPLAEAQATRAPARRKG